MVYYVDNSSPSPQTGKNTGQPSARSCPSFYLPSVYQDLFARPFCSGFEPPISSASINGKVSRSYSGACPGNALESAANQRKPESEKSGEKQWFFDSSRTAMKHLHFLSICAKIAIC